MVDGPEGAAVQFVHGGLTYRFEVRKPTVDELRDEYRREGGTGWGNVDWRGRVEREWKRRWRARVLWLKATLEFAAGEGAEEMERALLPYLVLPGGRTLATWTREQLPDGFRNGSMPKRSTPCFARRPRISPCDCSAATDVPSA
jgi:hypothetical protein